MLWLIDGYNLMYAAGAIGGKEIGRELFQRKRRQFLNRLAESLGPERSRETTVVFDANSPPPDFDLETIYRGISLIFALGDENADARIESIVARHATPKALTVVSTDRRVRQAATRRKAKVLRAEEFLDLLDQFRRQDSRPNAGDRAQANRTLDRDAPLSASEAEFWLAEFGEIADAPETREAFTPQSSAMITDEEIARIQREIDEEDRRRKPR